MKGSTNNYQKQLEDIIKSLASTTNTPKVMLHSCCAPCSSYCIEYLSKYFEICVFYYNPNIYPDEEYYHRVSEQKRFIELFPTEHKVSFIEGDFEKERFYELTRGYEKEKERGSRCSICFDLRLSKTAELAKELGYDYFCSTLTISPLKDADVLNSIGYEIADRIGISWLPSDFKKKNGYKRSTEISAEYNMYRQDYCGCVFSKQERELIKEN